MRLSIEVDERTYIPLAAIPYITDGFFTQREAIGLIAIPDYLCDCYGGLPLPALRVSSFGRLIYADNEELARLATICFADRRDPPLRMIADFVVPEEDLRELMERVAKASANGVDRERGDPSTQWDVEARLPKRVWEAVFKGIPQLTLDLQVPRANSADAMKERVKSAVDQISARAEMHGVPFDPHQLLGYKRQFIEILHKVDPRIARADTTLHAYLKDLGLCWKQGSRPKDAQPLMALFGLDDKSPE